jgi:peptide chain release factor
MWIQISSGKGPDECELAVSLFLKSYQNECQEHAVQTRVIAAIPGGKPGNLKSVLLALESPTEIICNKLISGTVLWICKSPYRPHHKRKNWFINIDVFAAVKQLDFSEQDVKFETLKSSGPGGQNVNKVETAVRAIHLPTGLTVTASEERSQFLNKKLALSRLANLITAKNKQDVSDQRNKMWRQHQGLERGNPIRIYEGADFKLKSSLE